MIRKEDKSLAGLRSKLRELMANYMSTEGCGCCQGHDHTKNKEALVKALNVKKYSDGSGYDFSKYKTKDK